MRHITDTIELRCPKCGEPLCDELEQEIKSEYLCKCGNHIYTYITHHEVFYTKGKMV
jgi:formylmethanofuran dehydrogenase subunit E